MIPRPYSVGMMMANYDVTGQLRGSSRYCYTLKTIILLYVAVIITLYAGHWQLAICRSDMNAYTSQRLLPTHICKHRVLSGHFFRNKSTRNWLNNDEAYVSVFIVTSRRCYHRVWVNVSLSAAEFIMPGGR
ncbi:hypothetical protein QTP88_010881 [Uroleucon formosanum]